MVKRDKELKNNVLKRLNLENQLNNKNHHKKCNVFHKKNEKIDDLSFTFNFKKANKSFSSKNLIKINDDLSRKNLTSTSFEKMLRNSNSTQKFTFSKTQKITFEKINFLNKKKQFSEKKLYPKKKMIILPLSKNDEFSVSKSEVTINEKDEFYWEDGANPNIIKKKIILPKIEESPNRKDFSKTVKFIKLSTLFNEEEDHSKQDKSNIYAGLKLSASCKPKSIRLINKPSGSNFNIPINKVKEGILSMSTSFNQFSPDKNQSNKKKIKEKSLDILENKERERKIKLINNISNEFSKLKNVKNKIHKTFDSALAELYDNALNNDSNIVSPKIY
jgi:hypothetical protein